MLATMKQNDDSYEGVALTRSRGADSQSQTFVTSREKLLDKLVESLTNRFQDVSVGVLYATRLISFANWPQPGEAAEGAF